ncbi:putative membrane protein [Halorubrum sp. AJ67]|nr:putative membrane protein [Halorubrum sp. AJ67]
MTGPNHREIDFCLLPWTVATVSLSWYLPCFLVVISREGDTF